MNPIERFLRRIDRSQQKSAPAAFAFGVVKKFGDDRAGSLAALIAYYGFASLFPLLLLLFTILGMTAGGDPAFASRVEHSALSQFPVIGTDLQKNIKVLHDESAFGLVIGIVGLLWGSQGAVQVGQYAMAEVWNVPGVDRPNFWVRLARTYTMMAVLGGFLVLSTAAAGVTSFAHSWPAVAVVGTSLFSIVVNVVLYIVAFRVLTPRQVPTRHLLPGAVLGGVAWTVFLYAGTLLIAHTLRHAHEVYGFFGTVLGLVAWIYLGAEMTMYMAELNVVRARRLWPRSIISPPLTEADRRVLEYLSAQGVRRPEQQVTVNFGEPQHHGGEAGAGEDPPPS
ncbi:MAG: YihY/virulence factor BrkB family protein [Acidimicrobiales bacterium]